MLKRIKTLVANRAHKAELKHIESLRAFADAEGHYVWISPTGNSMVIDSTTGAIVKF